jgi:hypothetical protein
MFPNERIAPAETEAEFRRIASELYAKGDLAAIEDCFFRLAACAQRLNPDASELIAKAITDALDEIVVTPRSGPRQTPSPCAE